MTPSKRRGKAHELPKPAERHLLELCRRRRGSPEHGLLIERRRQELGEDAGRAGADGEIGEKAGMVPVRQSRHEDALKVVEDGVERLTVLGGARWKRIDDVARA